MRTLLFFLIFLFSISTSLFGQLKQVAANGAIFNYTDNGSGETIIFIHGGLEDHRTWSAVAGTFSKHYRVITYSRRFNFPNQNTEAIKAFSAKTEAEDLAAVITKLELAPVHLVGHSFGGLISLFLVEKYPGLVRSLTLSEPALISWLPTISGGKILHDNFYAQLWKPVKEAFDAKDTVAALKYTLRYFAGDDIFDQLPAEAKTQLTANIREWQAIAYSPNAFPDFNRQKLKAINVPIMLLSGGQTLPIIDLTNRELKRLLPVAQQYHFPEGTHDFWLTHLQQMVQALLSFLDSVRPK